jgi:hypothetical protein
MPDIKKTGRDIENKVTSFLAGKPQWVWLVATVLITAVIFLICYVVFVMLTAKWWVSVILIVVIGVIWGAVAYSAQNKPEAKKSGGSKARKRSR